MRRGGRATGTKIGRRSLLGGGTALAAGSVLAAGSMAMVADAGPAGASGDGPWTDRLVDEAAIKRLGVTAALATDAITFGDMADALARFRAAFTEDAVIAAGFDPDAPLLSAVGPDAWAESVAAAYTTYSASQHLLGTCEVTFDDAGSRGRSRDARMTTYLHATFVVAATTDLLTVTGTYRDVVHRRDDDWRITERFLLFTSFESGVRDAPPPATA